jgi:Arylsulfotransferase (ASST)
MRAWGEAGVGGLDVDTRLTNMPTFLLVRAAAIALAASVLCVTAMSASPAGAETAATVVISPLRDTPDANPDTQVSFLGVPAAEISDIVVAGSSSGAHGGQLRPYSTGNGGSFVPSAPFTPGEHVTVSATVTDHGTTSAVGTSFTVASPYTLPAPAKPKHILQTPTNVLRFHSRHDLRPPAVTVATPAVDPSLGDIFVSPDSGPGQPGLMIVGPTGSLVWFDPLPSGTAAFDLNVQRYEGKPVLTWWQGEVVEGHGQGEDVIAATDYGRVATVHAGNGLYADLHDFQITSQGTAWLTAYEPEHWDLSGEGGLHHSLIDDGVVQEVDIKTGLVMFEWHALGHVAVSDTYMHVPHYPTTVLDFFHLNSIEPLADGQVLISSRNTWTTYLISQTDGSIVWRLGGKESTFNLGSGVHFAWQHDAQFLPDGTLSLFDNESFPDEAAESRAVDIALDAGTRTASLVRQFTYPGTGILSESQGDTQLLPNGDSFIGWGQVGQATEFAPSGAVTFDMHLAAPTGSYRAVRFPWSALPRTRPSVRAATPIHATQLWASWNGATGVASWRVLAGNGPSALKSVGSYPTQGFETAIRAPTTARYVEVQALSSTGAVMRSSPVVKT